MALRLNAFGVEFSQASFQAWVRKGNPDEIRGLREQLGGEWFFHLHRGVVNAIFENETAFESFFSSLRVARVVANKPRARSRLRAW